MKEKTKINIILFNMGLRKCLKCGEIKQTNEFYEHSSNREKLSTVCKNCTMRRKILNDNTHSGKAGKVYDKIVSRCNNPNDYSYQRYGDKGRKVLISRKDYVKMYLKATHCAMCGCEFIHGDSFKRKTTDRIDNSENYTIDNIQFLCNSCNSKKGNT